ncbi:MAG TPA: ABC transporter ATP-binding protein [Gemmatimonadales bacterium]|nr:ABC transporter ATP-binding protein [Gemmatimonadales bacterium]
MILEARAVSVRYRGLDVAALDGVSCGVAPGRLLAVVGPNGSGKTTLVRALAGLVVPRSGAVMLRDRAVASWSRPALARIMAVVSQREEVTFALSVAEAVMLGRYAHLGPLAPPRPADRAVVAAALARCDVADLAGRPVDTLSGGEWQRVRVARALAQEPEVLVLDEPTASLDVRHEMELFELIRQLVNGGLAGLVITHHINLAARFADQMVLLDRGRIAAEGAPAQVLRRDVLDRVFQWPLAVTQWSDGSPQVIPLRRGEG